MNFESFNERWARWTISIFNFDSSESCQLRFRSFSCNFTCKPAPSAVIHDHWLIQPLSSTKQKETSGSVRILRLVHSKFNTIQCDSNKLMLKKRITSVYEIYFVTIHLCSIFWIAYISVKIPSDEKNYCCGQWYLINDLNSYNWWNLSSTQPDELLWRRSNVIVEKVANIETVTCGLSHCIIV